MNPSARPVGSRVLLWGALLEAALGGIGTALAAWTGLEFWRRIDIGADQWLLGVALCLPMLAAFGWCLQSRWQPVIRIRSVVDVELRPYLDSARVIDCLVVALAAGLGEEAFFRGFFQDWLAMRFGAIPAIVLTSVMFGCLHPITRAYMVMAALFSVYLGCLWLTSGNLLVVALAHGIYDFLALLLLKRRWRLGSAGNMDSSLAPRPISEDP